jgi:hypothetical protein
MLSDGLCIHLKLPGVQDLCEELMFFLMSLDEEGAK